MSPSSQLVVGILAVCALAARQTEAQVLCKTGGISTMGKDRGFADCVALSGDVFAAGADEDKSNGRYSGAVHVFQRNGDVWEDVAKLLPDVGQEDAHFGLSVAISGARIVVGAPLHDVQGSDSGLAYVFERESSGDPWLQQATLMPDDARREDRFGYIAIDGDLIVAGAPGPSTKPGSAYVFGWNGSTWTQDAKLAPVESEINDRFGFRVAIAGGRIIVSAYGDDGAGANAGAVYVFEWNGEKWEQTARLLPDAPGTTELGRTLAARGDRIVASARNQSSGWVYVFGLADGQWIQEGKLTLNDGGVSDRFGDGLAFTDDRVIVGDYTKLTAYVYAKQDGAWVEEDELFDDDLHPDYDFGRSACADGDTIVVGAPGTENDGVKGWASVFEYTCGAPDNDTCDGRIALAFPSVTEGTTAGAAIDALDECAEGAAVIAPSVWYSVIGTGGWMQADTCAEDRFNTKLSVYEGTCDAPVCVTGNNNACETLSVVQWDSEPGVEYFIVVHGTLNESGDFTLTLSEPPGTFDCNRIDRLSAKCRGDGGETRTIKAKITSDLPPGTRLTFVLDGARTQERNVNDRGKAAVTFEDAGSYEHEVVIEECPWVAQVSDCGPEGSPDLVWITQGHSRGTDAAFSPDGQMLATAGGYQDRTVKIWRAADGELLQTLSGHNIETSCVAFSPDSQFVASGGRDSYVHLWRVSDGSRVWSKSHYWWVASVDFSPDQSLLAIGDRDGYLIVRSVADGSVVYESPYQHNQITGTRFSPDGTLLALLGYGIEIYQVSDWTRVRRILGAGSDELAFSPDGTLIASAESQGTVKVWRVSDGALVHTMPGHSDDVYAFDFSPDGTVLGTGSSDRTIRLWNVDDGSLLRMYDRDTGSTIYGFDFSPDGEHFGYVTNLGLTAVARNPF